MKRPGLRHLFRLGYMGSDMDVLPTRGEDLGEQGTEIECGDMKLEIRCSTWT